MIEWSRGQVEEFFRDKFVALTFDHYYKYVFTFIGVYQHWTPETRQREFYRCTCKDGGNHDDIYRYEVDIQEPKPLLPLSQWGNDIQIEKSTDRRNWEEIYYEYTY